MGFLLIYWAHEHLQWLLSGICGVTLYKNLFPSPLYACVCFSIKKKKLMRHFFFKKLFDYEKYIALLFYFYFFIYFFLESFNLWRLLLIIDLYYQIKTPISFWYRWGIESQIFYSIIRDFTSWTNWNPQLFFTLFC